MKTSFFLSRYAPTCMAVVALAGIAGAVAIAQPTKETKTGQPAKETTKAPGQPPEMQLPPGWTEADMQACTLAGTPGEHHEKMISKGTGTWTGTCKMWMAPGTEPMSSPCTSTVTSIMDGRYMKCEMQGEMPGMGTYHGSGVYGYDNVSQKFVSSWIDNHSTGIMNGTGALSGDGKVLTWTFSYNCPITKKPTVMREVETYTGENSKKLEMFGTEPKSGKEYKMMEIELTRKGK